MNLIKAGQDAHGKPVELHYCDYGQGDPIVLIHGWPLAAASWEELRAAAQVRPGNGCVQTTNVGEGLRAGCRRCGTPERRPVATASQEKNEMYSCAG